MQASQYGLDNLLTDAKSGLETAKENARGMLNDATSAPEAAFDAGLYAILGVTAKTADQFLDTARVLTNAEIRGQFIAGVGTLHTTDPRVTVQTAYSQWQSQSDEEHLTSGAASILTLGAGSASKLDAVTTIETTEKLVDDIAPLFAENGPSGAIPQAGGTVVFRAPPGATAEKIAQVQAYINGSNEALDAGFLSASGRVSTKGDLRIDASAAAAEERAAASVSGTPYQGHAGHVPDTTWTGTPQPYSWLDLSPRVNSSLGGQARRYPLGYQPTKFEFEGPK